MTLIMTLIINIVINVMILTNSALVKALSSSRILSADWLRPVVLLPTTLTTWKLSSSR